MGNKPFLLSPAYMDYLWGGQRLKDEFHKETDLFPLAESWECSTHPDGPSLVVSGDLAGRRLDEVISEHPEYLGSHPGTIGELPILIKLIDASKDLSVQVHPTDEYASTHEDGESGKSEMWYVLDAAPGAELIYGLKQDLSREELARYLEHGDVNRVLRHIPIEKDDVFYIPAGTIHALGDGALVAEIQQNSNLTYRMYDYERLDKDGQKRALHLEKALDVASLTRSVSPRQPMRVLRYQPGMARELLCRCKYFEVHRMLMNTSHRQKLTFSADALSFRVLLCIDGQGSMEFGGEVLDFRKGDCIFVPADSVVCELSGSAHFLEVRG